MSLLVYYSIILNLYSSLLDSHAVYKHLSKSSEMFSVSSNEYMWSMALLVLKTYLKFQAFLTVSQNDYVHFKHIIYRHMNFYILFSLNNFSV